MSSYSVYHSMYCHNRVILAVYSECVYTVWGHISDISYSYSYGPKYYELDIYMSSYSVYHLMHCHNRVILAVYSECVYTVWGYFSDIIHTLTGQNTMNYTYTCHHIVYYTEYH